VQDRAHPACRVAGLAGSAGTSLMSRRQPSLCLVKHWSADRNVCIWVGADSLNERATATWRYRSAGSRSEHLPLGAQGPSLLAQLCAVAYALRALATSWELGSLFLRQVHIVGDTENSENEGRGDDTRAVSAEEDPGQSTTSASRSLGAPQPVGPWESPDTRPKGVPLLRHAAWRRASNTSARWRPPDPLRGADLLRPLCASQRSRWLGVFPSS